MFSSSGLWLIHYTPKPHSQTPLVPLYAKQVFLEVKETQSGNC